MIYGSILHKTFRKIPNTTDEEIRMTVDTLSHVSNDAIKDAMQNVATKDDIKDIEVRMATKDDIKNMATNVDIANVRTEIERVRTEVYELKASLTWRMIVVGGIITTIIGLLIKL